MPSLPPEDLDQRVDRLRTTSHQSWSSAQQRESIIRELLNREGSMAERPISLRKRATPTQRYAHKGIRASTKRGSFEFRAQQRELVTFATAASQHPKRCAERPSDYMRCPRRAGKCALVCARNDGIFSSGCLGPSDRVSAHLETGNQAPGIVPGRTGLARLPDEHWPERYRSKCWLNPQPY
jgi:hypothetical protein